MLAIRLQRNGRKHLPMYRIIVQEAQRHPLSGRVVAEVGNYNPATKALVLDKELVEKYLNNGAQPSSRVARILSKEGIKLPKWYQAPPKKQAKAKNPDKLRKNQPATEKPAETGSSEPTPTKEAEASEKPAESAESTEAESSEQPAEEAPATPAE